MFDCVLLNPFVAGPSVYSRQAGIAMQGFLRVGEFDMRHVMNFTAVALVVLVGGARAMAGATYEVTGKFGTNIVGNTGLQSGSFTATFEVATPLPLASGHSEPFENYSVSLCNSSSTLVSSFQSTSPVFLAGIANELTLGGRIDIANFVNPSTPAGLVLDFASGFNGTGPVTPFALKYSPVASAYTDLALQSPAITFAIPNLDLQSVKVASGDAFAVPEPSSIITAGIGSLMLLGVYLSRRRAKVAA
jgi:PEP-CTERM motif